MLPLANAEWNVALNAKHSVFGRVDFLPSPNGNVFLDGLFDVLFAFKTNLDQRKSVDAGVRLFFGGYDPNKPDDFANRVFFIAAVARYSWQVTRGADGAGRQPRREVTLSSHSVVDERSPSTVSTPGGLGGGSALSNAARDV